MQAEINSEKSILDFSADIYLANFLKAGSIADHEISRGEEALRSHWLNQGLDRSIHASTICSRQDFLNLINPRDVRLLEIGPFFNPAFKCNDSSIKYADLLSTEQLIERANALGGATDSIPTIDYLYKDGVIDTGSEKFDIVFSSHLVEHQPNLLGHMLNVLNVLETAGSYFFIVPDYRYCFDCYMNASSMAEVLAAFFEQRVKPSLKSVFEHRLFTIDYNKLPHVNPFVNLVDHAVPGLHAAMHEFSTNSYVDVHCWKFTSESFRHLIQRLVALGYLPATTLVRAYNLGDEFAVAIAFSAEAHPVFS